MDFGPFEEVFPELCETRMIQVFEKIGLLFPDQWVLPGVFLEHFAHQESCAEKLLVQFTELLATPVPSGTYGERIQSHYTMYKERLTLRKNFSRNSPCSCRSGRKYKKCCGTSR